MPAVHRLDIPHQKAEESVISVALHNGDKA